MRWAGTLILLALVPVHALAEPLVVRSGEHPGFSRLVLQFTSLPQWTFGTVEGGYELRSGATDTPFDLSRIYQRIPRTRISDVSSPGPGRLFLRLGCPCIPDVFELPGGRLVIDVRDEAGPGGAPSFPQLPPLAKGEGWKADNSSAFPNEADKQADQERKTPEELRKMSPSLNAAVRTGADNRPDSTLLFPFSPDAGAGKLPAMEQALLLQLSRAAAQGMIRLDTPFPEPRATEAPPLPEPGKVGPDQSLPPAEVAPGTQLHFRVQTASDRDAQKWPTNAPTTENGLACLPEALFDIASWETRSLPEGLISPPDLAILGEFDEPDPDRLLSLVRGYLFLGFGAEAKAAMRAFGMELPEFPLLSQMADIMDGKRAAPNGPLQQQLSCATPGAMWALLASGDTPAIRIIDRQSVLRAFSALPPHLKKLLGPPLAERFLAGKDLSTATTVRNIMARAPGTRNRKLALLDASLAKENGKTDEALNSLEKAIHAGEGDAETMVRLLQARLQAGLEIESRDIDLALSMAAELRGTETGSTLARLAIMALLESGKIEIAMETARASSENGILENGPAEKLVAQAQLRNASTSNDADFVRLVLQYPLQDTGLSDTAMEAGLAVAKRLAELGLVALARGWVDPLGDSPSARLVRAEIELADANPAAVEPLLNGMETPEAQKLRAVAREMMGDLATAARLYASLNMTDRAESARLRSGDLSSLTSSDNKIRTAAARLLAATNPSLPSAEEKPPSATPDLQEEPQASDALRPAGPADPELIESSRRFLDQSQALRNAVAELLNQ